MVSILTPVAPANRPIVSGAARAFVIASITLCLDPVVATGCTVADMIVKSEPATEPIGRGPRVLAITSLLAALAASSCCILPVLLFSLGISGAWIGNLTQLAPYKPIFVVATLAFVGGGYWLVYRASKRACADAKHAEGRFRTRS